MSTLAQDEILLRSASAQPDKNPPRLVDVQWEYVNSTSNSYTGGNSILLAQYGDDCNFRDYANSYLSIPFEMQALVNPQVENGISRLSLKPAGYLGLIDKLTVLVNGHSLSLGNGMLSVYRWLCIIFDWSLDYWRTNAPMRGFGSCLPEDEVANQRIFPATGAQLTAFRCNDVAKPPIGVVSNNATIGSVTALWLADQYDPQTLIFPSNSPVGTDITSTQINTLATSYDSRYTTTALKPVNFGMVSRIQAMVYNPNSASGNVASYSSAMGQNYVNVNSTSSVTYVCNAWIRMGDLHDLFQQLGVARNLNIQMTLNFNQSPSTGTINVVAATTGITTAASWNAQFSPMMVAQGRGVLSAGASTAVSTVTMTNPTANYLCIGRTLSGTSASNIQWWIPRLNLQESDALKLASVEREVRYTDFNAYTNITNQSVGSNFTAQVVTGVQNPRRMWVMAYPSVVGSIFPAGSTPFTQCSSFEPYGSSKGVMLSNLVPLINGSPIYTQAIDTAQREFAQNITTLQGLNAGYSGRLSSGLWSWHAQQSNPIYGFDLTRFCQGKNSTASITLKYTNSSLYAVDLLVVVEQMYSFTLKYSANACIVGIPQPI